MNKEVMKNILNILYDSIEDEELTERETLENYVEKYIQFKEGLECCFDKTSYLIDSMISSKIENKNIILTETYQDLLDKGMNVGQIKDFNSQCYWVPKTFKDTNEAWQWFKTQDENIQTIMKNEIEKRKNG